MKKITALFTVLLAASCGQSKETPVSEQTATIKIPTAQCSMCEHNISTALTALKGVTKAEVDATAKTAVVTYMPVDVKVEDLERAITLAGYDANDKKRDMTAYEALDACCKIPEEGKTPDSM